MFQFRLLRFHVPSSINRLTSCSLTFIAGSTVSCRPAIIVRVGSRPLKVDKIRGANCQAFWDKVVFHGGKRLNDIAAFAANI